MKFVTKSLPYIAAAAAGVLFVSVTDMGARVGSKLRQLIKGTAA